MHQIQKGWLFENPTWLENPKFGADNPVVVHPAVRTGAGDGRRFHKFGGRRFVGPRNTGGGRIVVLPKSVSDPIEPFNRVMWGFNKWLMTDVIKPTSKVYRFVVRKPIRTDIGNFGRNLTYPGRLINNLLQAKWRGACDETYRFVCNTTVGIVGFWDVGTKWKIPKSDADFGQTFGKWGWKPECFIMLPVFGPSNERDTLGLAADTAANPLLYIAPYKFDANKPLTYLGPYSYFTCAVMYNDLSGHRGRICAFQPVRNGSIFRDSIRMDIRAGDPGGRFPGERKTGRSFTRNSRICFLHLPRP